MHSVSDVIRHIVLGLSFTDPDGLSVEPIATRSDPDNKIHGDYVVRVTYVIQTTDNKSYCVSMEAYLRMREVCRYSEEKLQLVVQSLMSKAVDFKALVELDGIGPDSVVIGAEGVSMELGSVLREAREMLKSTKH